MRIIYDLIYIRSHTAHPERSESKKLYFGPPEVSLKKQLHSGSEKLLFLHPDKNLARQHNGINTSSDIF